jgi:hypothetical protein
MALLNEQLSSVQLDQLRSVGYFEVIGGTTGKRYRIRSECQMNVEEIGGNGRRVCLLCFGPTGRLALGDILLAQKVALELFESEALAVANKIPTEYSHARMRREPTIEM